MVNLIYKDHVLAHYYLSLCTTDVYKYAMISAIYHIIGNVKQMKNRSKNKSNTNDLDYNTLLEFIGSLDNYQELYEFRRKEISNRLKGRKIKF